MSGTAALRTVLRPARQHAGRLAAGGGAGFLASASSVALLVTGAWLVARAAERPPVVALSVAVVAVRAFAVTRACARYAERLLSHDATLRVLSDLRVRLYRRLERLAPSGLPVFRSGDLLARLVGDLDAVQDVFLRALLPWLTGTAVGLLAAAAVALLLPSAGLVLVAATLLVALVVPALSARAADRAQAGVAREQGTLTEQVVDTLERLPELVAYEALELRDSHLRDTEGRLARYRDTVARVRGLGVAAVALTTGGAVWAGLALGASAVRSGALAPVWLAVIALLPLALAEVLAPLPAAASELSRSTRAADRVEEVELAPDPVQEPAVPAPIGPGPWHLRVEDLAARWTPDGRPALSGVDLDLPPGRRVLLVGPSGSGKTTLAHVLLRFLDPAAGRVLLDGTDTRLLPGDDVRRVVGLLAQDAHVFDSTLRQNLLLARPDASVADLRVALRRARLLDWVDRLPEGLDTWVGNHGDRLSGGERQRLALARVLLADFPVLVLDEPTEHLDAATADALVADLVGPHAVTAGRTLLAVTHRLRGFEGFDEVLVLDHGRVVERGTHDELVRRDGWYAAAYHDEGTSWV
jgi:thiol reductant ABC exporter CydC subunit